MKFIDEKGRLFGKWNIIDAGVVLFILGLTPMVYYSHKLFNRPPINWEQKYKEEKTGCQNKTDFLQRKIDNYLKEHKRAAKYFK